MMVGVRSVVVFVNVEVKSGKEWVKRAMFSTMGKQGHPDKPLSDQTWFDLLMGRHSPIEEYEIWVDAIVPERVHTHVVRHKELGKYVATSRPDISYHKELKEGERVLSLRLNAKRLIEVSWVRLCKCSWSETIELFEEIKRQVLDIDLELGIKLQPSCVWFAGCPESKCCGYNKTPDFSINKNLLWNN